MSEQTESVKIIIDAEDRATETIRKVTEEIKKNVKNVREAGTSIKDVGSVASAFGATGVGLFAVEVSGLTEKFRALNSMRKKGAIANVAFRASLVATSAVIGVKVGQAIGERISQADIWKEKLAAVGEEFDKLAAKALSGQQNRHRDKVERANLIIDPDRQRKAIDEIASLLDKNLDSVGKAIAKKKKALAFINDSAARRMFGQAVMKADIELAGKQLSQFEAQRDVLREQRQELRMMGSESEKSLALLRERHAEEKKSQSFLKSLRESVSVQGLSAAARQRNEAVKGTNGVLAEQEALMLIKQRDAFIAKAKAEADAAKLKQITADKAKRTAEIAIQNQKRSLSLHKSITSQLLLKAIAIKDGDEAAAAARFEAKGFSKKTADKLAAINAFLNKKADPKATASGPNTANQSRFVSGRAESARQSRAQREAAKRAKAEAERKEEAAKMITVLVGIQTNTENQIVALGK